ncbi:Crp/Fnr family transcriptional regulator [Telmatospirillum siberiense]|uniref:Crp/Fnr family transcriptional regulator n=1 Tax=Telmatospirillum siberiense TaxID=382514 RepID=A0A2N3PY72_9PROT|nr:Crp/Fnr family transcriptional regulator [Telmatospirillum siberiense]PKU25362.1 Crp/Fnr family transcriptional regulator [Telmatospirillum siberiense]
MKKGRIDSAWGGGTQCRDCGIRDLVLFADLQQNDFSLIHLPIEEIDIEAGKPLYSAGNEGDALFTVRAGLIKLVQYLPDGMQRTVRLLKHGATAGLEVTVGQPYEHTAIALQPTSACRIPRLVVERLSRETPRLHRQLMERWHQALHQADDWLTELSTGKASQRLARLLIHLVETDGTVTLFSREDLGAMLGITTEHASRTVAELKRRDALFELAGNRYRCDIDQLECIAAADC